MSKITDKAAWLAIVLMLIMGLAALSSCNYKAARQENGGAGTRVAGGSKEHPGFPLPDLQGKLIGPDDYRGKVVLVNFWATWCPPCRREIPDFKEIYEQYHTQGLEILGIAMDDEGAPVVKPFVEEIKINYPVLLGNDKVGEAYEIEGMPTTLVLDRQGKLHKRLVGLRSRAELETLIKSLL